MSPVANTLSIRTPEGVTFSLTLAGPVSRFLAWVVDLCCIAVITESLRRILGGLGVVSADLAAAVTAVVFFVVSIGYGIACEWRWRGSNRRKAAASSSGDGSAGSAIAAKSDRHSQPFAIRGHALPAFYLVGGLTCLINRQGQRLGDIAGNTVVAHTPDVGRPDLDQLSKGRFNSLAQHRR